MASDALVKALLFEAQKYGIYFFSFVSMDFTPYPLA
jgi:hypothetical protein